MATNKTPSGKTRDEHIKDATAQRVQKIFQPGTGDDTDPDHLERTSGREDIGGWLHDVEANIDAKRRTDRARSGQSLALFSQWERTTLKSFRDQYDKHCGEVDSGSAPPESLFLTGKQLVVLRNMVNKIAHDTAKGLGDGDV